jgi:hypothetical protein
MQASSIVGFKPLNHLCCSIRRTIVNNQYVKTRGQSHNGMNHTLNVLNFIVSGYDYQIGAQGMLFFTKIERLIPVLIYLMIENGSKGRWALG